MKDETRRKIDKAVKISLIIAGLLLICNDIYWRWHGGSGTQADNNVNRTMESIQRENKSAGSEVETAEEHVNRTADAIKRSEETAHSNARSTDELQALISECKGIVEAQRGIIRDVDRANGIRPEENEQN